MPEIERIEIALSKSKLTRLLMFSIVFLCAGIWVILSNPQISNPALNSPIVKAIASYGSAIMGLWGTYFFSRKLFDNKPGLVIEENGIYDNTSAFNVGLIAWNDISRIHGRTIHVSIASKQHFITIELFNPDKYISKEKNLLKRKLLSANASSYGSPVHISTNGLKIGHSELLQLLTGEYTKHKAGTDE